MGLLLKEVAGHQAQAVLRGNQVLPALQVQENRALQALQALREHLELPVMELQVRPELLEHQVTAHLALLAHLEREHLEPPVLQEQVVGVLREHQALPVQAEHLGLENRVHLEHLERVAQREAVALPAQAERLVRLEPENPEAVVQAVQAVQVNQDHLAHLAHQGPVVHRGVMVLQERVGLTVHRGLQGLHRMFMVLSG